MEPENNDMNSDKESITGIILAGGAGNRVGGRDKGLIIWQGRPLIEHCVQRLAPQVSGLIISCNRNLDSYRQYSSQLVEDANSNYQGPLAGLVAAAEHVQTDLVLVAPCDVPQLPVDLVSRLLGGLNNDEFTNADVSYAKDDSHRHYLCALVRASALATLPGYLATGQRAVKHWYASLNTTSVDFSDCSDCFLNLNSSSQTTN
jgi:molybdopterin-guanine dinucleotide biosynthesis protein A